MAVRESLLRLLRANGDLGRAPFPWFRYMALSVPDLLGRLQETKSAPSASGRHFRFQDLWSHSRAAGGI